jgi:hypothetical protein
MQSVEFGSTKCNNRIWRHREVLTTVGSFPDILSDKWFRFIPEKMSSGMISIVSSEGKIYENIAG